MLKRLIGVFLFSMVVNVVSADIKLAENGTANCSILIPSRPAKAVKISYKGLVKYLKEISGADFQVKEVDPKQALTADSAIVIGIPPKGWKKELKADDFVITVKGNKLYLFGNNPTATGYSVYAFLEEVLGCRWLTYNEDIIPKKASITVSLKLNKFYSNPFLQADIYNQEAQKKNTDAVYKFRSISTEKATGDHTMNKMLKQYGDKDKRIFALVKDKKSGKMVRKYNKLHFCYTAPGIVDALVTELSKEVEKRNGNVKDFLYFAGMGDWYGGMCKCETCQKVYDKESWTNPDGRKFHGYSATLITMMNEVAAKLEKKYPGITLGTFAYMSLEQPPKTVRPRKNLMVWMPHLRHCIGHTVSKSCKGNKEYYQGLKRWCEIAPGQIYVWDYTVGFGANFMYPFPCIKSIAENIRTYRKLGCRGIYLQGDYVSTGSDLVALKNYVYKKIIWDPTLKVDDLIDEFCDTYYGPSAPAMKKYVKKLEDAIENSDVCFNEFSNPGVLKKSYLSDALVKELSVIMAQAVKAAGEKEPYFRRIKEAEASLMALKYWKDNPNVYLEPRNGNLVRSDYDFKNVFPQMEEMLKYSRLASKGEWSWAVRWHERCRRSHGGPLPSLKSGNLEVQVAPVQEGRIYQIKYKGKDLLFSQYKNKRARKDDTRSVIKGGHQRLQQGQNPAWYRIKKQTKNKLVQEADCGISMWNNHTQLIATQEISVKNNTILIKGSSLKVANNRNRFNDEECNTVTNYAVKDKSKIQLAYTVDGRSWQKIDLSKVSNGEYIWNKPKPGLSVKKKFKALRLTDKEKGYVLTDNYLKPGAVKLDLYWDGEKGIFTTSVISKKVNTVKSDKGLVPENWIVRKIQVK